MLKIKKKNNDTILGIAKNELKRLGNAYTDNIASQIKLPDWSADVMVESSEINWEEMANNINSFKIRLLKDRVTLKERPRKLLNNTKRRSFRIKPKEDIKDSDKLSTLEWWAQEVNNIDEEKCISNELDVMLNENSQIPINTHPLSIESNSAHVVYEKMSSKDSQSKPRQSWVTQMNIQASSNDGVRFRSIWKKPQNLFSGTTLNKRGPRNRLKKTNAERYVYLINLLMPYTLIEGS